MLYQQGSPWIRIQTWTRTHADAHVTIINLLLYEKMVDSARPNKGIFYYCVRMRLPANLSDMMSTLDTCLELRQPPAHTVSYLSM